MEDYVFEVIDKTGRKIHLSKERWSHIRKKHPEIENLELIEQTIKNPDKVIPFIYDEKIYYFYKYFKNLKAPKQYLLIIIKYLNGEGFIITAYLEKDIKGI
jgi:hypothetical protein